jgi:hypothetical protein
MKRLSQSILDSKWKAALFGFGMVFCYSWCIAAWIEWGSDGLKAFFQPLGMIFVTLWFFANFKLHKEQDEEAGALREQLRYSEDERLYAKKKVSELEGIIEKARTRSRERRQGNNQ